PTLPETLRSLTPTAIRRARPTATPMAPAPTATPAAAPIRTAAPTPVRPPAATPPTTAIPRPTASPRRTPVRMIGPTPRPMRTPTVRTRGPRAPAAATRIPLPRTRTPVRTKTRTQRIPRTTMTVPVPHWDRPTQTAALRTRRPATAPRTDGRPSPEPPATNGCPATRTTPSTPTIRTRCRRTPTLPLPRTIPISSPAATSPRPGRTRTPRPRSASPSSRPSSAPGRSSSSPPPEWPRWASSSTSWDVAGSRNDARMDLFDSELRVIASARELASSLGADAHHTVAAAAMDTTGRIHTGVNVNHCTGGSCAEIVAIGTAAAAGAGPLVTIAAVGDHDRGVLSPCGRCRQVILDLHPDALLILPDRATGAETITAVPALLPHAYRHPDAAPMRLLRLSARYFDAVRTGTKTLSVRWNESHRRGPAL